MKKIEVDVNNNVVTVDTSSSSNIALFPEVNNNIITVTNAASTDIEIVQPVVNTVTVESASQATAIELVQNITNVEISDSVIFSTPPIDGTIAVTAAEDISSGDVIAVNESGEAELADNTDTTQTPFQFGFAQQTVLAGQTVTVKFDGTETTTGLTLGVPLFVGTSGGYTQTLPTSGYVKIIGKPITTIQFVVGLHLSITLA